MSKLDAFTKQAICAAIPRKLIREVIREIYIEETGEVGEGLLRIETVQTRIGEHSRKSTFAALRAMKVPVREISGRRFRVRQADLDAAIVALPVKDQPQEQPCAAKAPKRRQTRTPARSMTRKI